MSGRPGPSPGPQSLRLEVLKELQQLIDNRDQRDRLDRGPLAETKGREHWVLHLLLRAHESEQAHLDTLIGTAYSNLLARLSAMEDRLARLEEMGTTLDSDWRARAEQTDSTLSDRVDQGLSKGMGQLSETLSLRLGENLDQKWKPVGDSIETFAQGSKQVLKDVADTYRVATQTRLLLNENARRITDIGRDIVALEESLKLVVARTLEEGLSPLEARVSALESHNGVPRGGTHGTAAEERNGEPATGQ